MRTGVYKIVRRATGDTYVGISTDPQARWVKHKSDARLKKGFRLHRAIAKHGVEAFDFHIIAALPTHKEAQIAERILIALERPTYNLTLGGEGTLGLKRPPCKPETRQKMRAARVGKKLTPEHKANISKSGIGRPGPNKGLQTGPRNLSPETRARIGAAQAGKIVSAETRAKQSASAKARQLPRNNRGQFFSQ